MSTSTRTAAERASIKAAVRRPEVRAMDLELAQALGEAMQQALRQGREKQCERLRDMVNALAGKPAARRTPESYARTRRESCPRQSQAAGA
jgi:hypothetical protein